jgi:hypothetical protein
MLRLRTEPFIVALCLFFQSGQRRLLFKQATVRFPGTALAFKSYNNDLQWAYALCLPLGVRESFTVIREASNITMPLSGVVGNPQARANYQNTREVIASPLDKVTPLESVEAEISRLTWAVIDGIATPADRDRLAVLVNEQHAYRRA